jgi:hypothetical protein
MIGDLSFCAYVLCLKSRSDLMRFISELLSELGELPYPWPDPPGHEFLLARAPTTCHCRLLRPGVDP